MASQVAAPLPVALVVEDEPLARMYAAAAAACRGLCRAAAVAQDAGFKEIQAGNADEAILLLEAQSDIRVVFTDIEMPGSMDGLKLAKAIRNRWPPIEVIATSGRYSVSVEQLPSRGGSFPNLMTAPR